MRNKGIIWTIIAILVIIFLGWWILGGDRNQDLNNNDNDGEPNDNGEVIDDGSNRELVTLNDSVKIRNPQSGDTINSPLIVNGEARGPWFFEASFVVRLIGPSGEELAVVPAQAQGEWMTEDFVPFRAELSFIAPTSGEGELILEKANPSGLPENADSVSIPVFVQKTETMTVDVYFIKQDTNNNVFDCTLVHSVSRTIPKTQAVARAALKELLKGPTEKDIQNKYSTNIPAGVQIQSLEIREGVAYVDFSDALDRNVGGSCATAAIRSQITETLKQFSTVNDVVISINGNTEDILQP